MDDPLDHFIDPSEHMGVSNSVFPGRQRHATPPEYHHQSVCSSRETPNDQGCINTGKRGNPNRRFYRFGHSYHPRGRAGFVRLNQYGLQPNPSGSHCLWWIPLSGLQ